MSKSKEKKIKYKELEHMLKNELTSNNRVIKDGPTDSKPKHISKKEPTDRKSNRVIKDGPTDSRPKHISKKEPTDRKSNRVIKDGPTDSGKSKHNFFGLPFVGVLEANKGSGDNIIKSTWCGVTHKKLKEECKNYFEYNNKYIDSCVDFINLLEKNELLDTDFQISDIDVHKKDNIDVHKKDEIVSLFKKLKEDGTSFGAHLWRNDLMPKKLQDFYGESLTSKFAGLWSVFPDGSIICQLFDTLFTKMKDIEFFDNLKDETTKEQYNKLRSQLVRHKKLLNDIYVHIKKLDKEIEKNNAM